MTRGVIPPIFSLKLGNLGFPTHFVTFILILGFRTFHVLDFTFGFTFRFTGHQHQCTLVIILADFCHLGQGQIFIAIHLTFQILVLDVGQHPIPNLIIALIPIAGIFLENISSIKTIIVISLEGSFYFNKGAF